MSSKPRTGSAGAKKKPKEGLSGKLIKSEFPSNIHIVRGQGEAPQIKRVGDSKTKPKVKLDGLFNSHSFESLPKFKDVPEAQRGELFKAKLRLCQECFNFKDPKTDIEQKEQKKNTLLELVDYLNANSTMYNAENLQELMRCVEANIFRTLGRGSPLKTQTMDPDEEEPNLEEAWPHY